MDKDKILSEIFNDDPLGILNVKPKASAVRTADERLIASFQEINDFYQKYGKAPEPNIGNIQEYQLYHRLQGIRENADNVQVLASEDVHGLLQTQQPIIESFDDIFADDSFYILSDDSEGLFDFKHTPKQDERASTDFVAKRKPCKDFGQYESLFKSVQSELSKGKRKLVKFDQKKLRAGEFYVNNGILLYLEKVDVKEEKQDYKSGSRVRKDGRTRIIFENGTESKMKYRSLYKSLLANGQAITQNMDEVNEGFIEQFSHIEADDKEAGYIYVLRSKSTNEAISSIRHLYKIGYTETEVEKRIENSAKEPTYLMADVDYIAAWKCFNMNAQKFEQLIHMFFGNSCLDIDLLDTNGNRYRPREWFIAPLEVIEQAIALIINGKVVEYKYDATARTIVRR